MSKIQLLANGEQIWSNVAGLYNYWVVVFLMMTGFYIMLACRNLIKSIIGLNVFQTSVFLLYITMGKVRGGTAPIIPPATANASNDEMAGQITQQIIYSNPLPSVLMLTAIVVGIATTSLALALVVRIREDYGTINEDEIFSMESES